MGTRGETGHGVEDGETGAKGNGARRNPPRGANSKALAVAGLAALLIGCGDAAPIARSDAGAGEDSQAAEASAGDEAARPDAGAEDSAAPDSGDLAECRAGACKAATAECGAISASCGGLPVSCGQCQANYACGDNGHANQCGNFCLNLGLGNMCAQQGLPSGPSFHYGCSAPYLSIANGNPVLRQGGLAGCQLATVGNQSVYCCP